MKQSKDSADKNVDKKADKNISYCDKSHLAELKQELVLLRMRHKNKLRTN